MDSLRYFDQVRRRVPTWRRQPASCTTSTGCRHSASIWCNKIRWSVRSSDRRAMGCRQVATEDGSTQDCSRTGDSEGYRDLPCATAWPERRPLRRLPADCSDLDNRPPARYNTSPRDGFHSTTWSATYNDKHNEANGENRDGKATQRKSWVRCRGPSLKSPDILALHVPARCATWTTLMVSQGTPMIAHGEVKGAPQYGLLTTSTARRLGSILMD